MALSLEINLVKKNQTYNFVYNGNSKKKKKEKATLKKDGIFLVIIYDKQTNFVNFSFIFIY